MLEKPKVVISRTRRPEPAARNFIFTEAMLPADDALKDYRAHAWETYSRLAMPNVSEEAWRRTDLRELPVESFRLPIMGAFRDLAPVPAGLLKPLTGDRHGGQVILLPGGGRSAMDPELARKNVFFTSLRSASMENPKLVARMAGELVRPEEGKFAALEIGRAHV
jgi:Fe-S cluster assembly protein SufD